MKATEIITLAKEALSTEIQELKNTKDRIDTTFAKAVEKIFETKGKLVIVGIGKSAHVAHKIVATLNSTGTPSQFLHASEALHGDLGLLASEDVVLCISNSGNSPEIVSLAPILKKYASYLIGMTGNPQSKLAEIADLVISSEIAKEADPNQLAPTSSTTVQMALGDALAVCLIALRNFGKQDFAKFHPGGALGKNLIATVGQFISDNRPEVNETANIREVIVSISASKHGITVVTKGDDIIGVITDGDLRRMLMKDEEVAHFKACEIMSKNPKTIEQSSLAREAMQILKTNNIGQLVVTNQGKYIGIIDIHKLLDEGIN